MSRAARILVVDDEPSALATTHAQLLPEGHDLRLVTSGADALAHLGGEPADVVVCDVMMPALDGFAVCRAFKADPGWRLVPIILLTALGDGAAVVRGLDAGADEFVTKPVEGAVLRARVRAMLRVRRSYDLLRAAAAPDRREHLMARGGLTGREREVLELILLGRTHEDIGLALGISQRTSKFHSANLLAKLGAESRLDLMRLLL